MKPVLRHNILVLPVLLLLHGGVQAQQFPLWGSLKPGPYPVGFRTFFKHDYSRTFKPEFDLEGHRRTGDRGRPMQAAVWYPAAKEAGASRIRFGAYIELLATEEGKVEASDSVRNAAMQLFITSTRRHHSTSMTVSAKRISLGDRPNPQSGITGGRSS